LAAGAVLNIVVAVMLIVGAYASGSPEAWVVKISDVEPGSAAAEAGLQPNDIVLAQVENLSKKGWCTCAASSARRPDGPSS